MLFRVRIRVIAMILLDLARLSSPFFISRKTARSALSNQLRSISSSQQQPPDLISSTKSQTVKKIHALLTKRKKRTELGLTVVEGPRMIFDLLDNPKTRPLVQQVVVSIDDDDHKKQNDWTERLLSNYDNLFVSQATQEVLKTLSDTVTPQGLVATVSIPPSPLTTEPPPSSSSPSSNNRKEQPLYLLLDGVSDPGNMGTLLRSSVAVGVAGVILLPGCCDVWNPKALRSSMGTSFQIPILSVDSWQEAKEVMTNWNVHHNIYAATMEESSRGSPSLAHYEIEWNTQASGLLIGSEGNGLSDGVRMAVTSGEIRAVHIPMEPDIESLNAAVCGSVILFEYLRQCRVK